MGFWGCIIGVFGAFILAVDKGALCLTLSAFDTLPETDFIKFAPYLQVIVDKSGLLKVCYLLPLLPLGAIIQSIGLIKERYIDKWQCILMIVGLLLLNNPDVELISSVGTILMCFGYFPIAKKVFHDKFRLIYIIKVDYRLPFSEQYDEVIATKFFPSVIGVPAS